MRLPTVDEFANRQSSQLGTYALLYGQNRLGLMARKVTVPIWFIPSETLSIRQSVCPCNLTRASQ
jgi:hypothetical protein